SATREPGDIRLIVGVSAVRVILEFLGRWWTFIVFVVKRKKENNRRLLLKPRRTRATGSPSSTLYRPLPPGRRGNDRSGEYTLQWTDDDVHHFHWLDHGQRTLHGAGSTDVASPA
ncbi:unnamed protein product, partial [Ectocarpus sp. 12 AP-2014]